jgi:putative transposase
MPWGLKRYQQTRQLHFITFSCYHRAPLLGTEQARHTFVSTLERVRQWYGFYVVGYVVMPEHVHLLMSEPGRGTLALALQMAKQIVSRKLGAPSRKEPFWQPRYYDFNVWSQRKRVEKLRYLHRNPVKRGLVASPEDWVWSSFRHYVTGEEGAVEIESQWTARKRERLGVYPTVSRTGFGETPAFAKDAKGRATRPAGKANQKLAPVPDGSNDPNLVDWRRFRERSVRRMP